jgi:hypothetical protein
MGLKLYQWFLVRKKIWNYRFLTKALFYNIKGITVGEEQSVLMDEDYKQKGGQSNWV